MRLRQAIKILKRDWRGKQHWIAFDTHQRHWKSAQVLRYNRWIFGASFPPYWVNSK